jgi:hypothetical protein
VGYPQLKARLLSTASHKVDGSGSPALAFRWLAFSLSPTGWYNPGMGTHKNKPLTRVLIAIGWILAPIYGYVFVYLIFIGFFGGPYPSRWSIRAQETVFYPMSKLLELLIGSGG